MLEESNSEDEKDPCIASDDDNHVPIANHSTTEESDIEQETVIEQTEEDDSEEIRLSTSFESIWMAKGRTE